MFFLEDCFDQSVRSGVLETCKESHSEKDRFDNVAVVVRSGAAVVVKVTIG